MHELEMKAMEEIASRRRGAPQKGAVAKQAEELAHPDSPTPSVDRRVIADSLGGQNEIRLRRLLDELADKNSKIRADAAFV